MPVKLLQKLHNPYISKNTKAQIMSNIHYNIQKISTHIISDNTEEWKPIKGANNYLISSKGNVKNISTGRILKHTGNDQVTIYSAQSGKTKTSIRQTTVRALVDEAFGYKQAVSYSRKLRQKTI